MNIPYQQGYHYEGINNYLFKIKSLNVNQELVAEGFTSLSASYGKPMQMELLLLIIGFRQIQMNIYQM